MTGRLTIGQFGDSEGIVNMTTVFQEPLLAYVRRIVV